MNWTDCRMQRQLWQYNVHIKSQKRYADSIYVVYFHQTFGAHYVRTKSLLKKFFKNRKFNFFLCIFEKNKMLKQLAKVCSINCYYFLGK